MHAKERPYCADYVKFARRLISALKESIEADLSPASEVEVNPSHVGVACYPSLILSPG